MIQHVISEQAIFVSYHSPPQQVHKSVNPYP